MKMRVLGGMLCIFLFVSIVPTSSFAQCHNDYFPEDVNGDWEATSSDAWIVINYLNGSAPGKKDCLDVNNDGHIAPMDVMLVINYLNNPPSNILRLEYPSGEAGAFTSNNAYFSSSASARRLDIVVQSEAGGGFDSLIFNLELSQSFRKYGITWVRLEEGRTYLFGDIASNYTKEFIFRPTFWDGEGHTISCNRPTGMVTVNDVSYDGGNVDKLDISYLLRCYSNDLLLSGSLLYDKNSN